jgi:hypothetical protein
MKHIFKLLLAIFLLIGYTLPDTKDNALKGLKYTPIHILFYQDDNVTIYHHKDIDTNQVFLIPASEVYQDLAYFDKQFKIC